MTNNDQNNEQNDEIIDNERLCKILKDYYGEVFHVMNCFFPHGNDFSMPYKPCFNSIVFGSTKRNILVDYTPDFPLEKANSLSKAYDWNYIFRNSEKENGQMVFHGIFNKVDRFDLIVPREVCTALDAYFNPTTNNNRAKRGRPKNSSTSKEKQ